MKICNTAAYQFVSLDNLRERREYLLAECKALRLKGTILLSPEGVNLMLAGAEQAVEELEKLLQTFPEFSEMRFKHSYSETIPFQHMWVKIKREIIPLDPTINPKRDAAPYVTPQELRRWLDQHPEDVILLDTRNDYEIAFGAFKGAQQLHLKHFRDFAKKLGAYKTNLKGKKIVTYCTGGIRCEKASAVLLKEGFDEVHQLEGGILNYFASQGAAHYDGQCYVFDARVTVDADLNPVVVPSCPKCSFPLAADHACSTQEKS